MSEKLQPVRGTHDLLPEDFARQEYITQTAQRIASLYGYARMDTPIFEFSEVFHRAVGETSDIVSKETYTFTDRGGESLTLRPEFTAAIVRAFVSNGLQQNVPFKCFYAGPAFRYERPQKGRMRQFHQIGCELLGAAQPVADVEMIALAAQTLRELGLADAVTLELNSLGDIESRGAYRAALVEYLTRYEKELSAESQTRLSKNPLRILDSKSEADKKITGGAPKLEDYFTPAARDFFARVTEGLARLNIPYRLNSTLVRGLDYYNHTVFEFTTDKLGAQGTVLAGGRYDGLVGLMGGNDTPGIGFAAGVERLVGLREALGLVQTPAAMAQLAVVPVEEAADAAAWELAETLRQEGFSVEIAYHGNAGKRLKRADKLGCRYALLMGEEELAKGSVMVKNLADGTQVAVARAELVTWLKERITR
ncbi:MAG: histidine--tRNA ligase [Alphaproteobacteria bacterium]